MTSNYSWLLGVLFSIIGTCFANLGIVIQTYAQRQILVLDVQERIPYIKSKTWWYGLVSIIIGNIFPFIALSFASQSVISPMYSFNLIWNLLFSKLILKELIVKTDIFGVILIIIGCTISALYGSHINVEFDIILLKKLYFDQILFQIYIIVMTLIIIIEWYLVTRIITPLREQIQSYIDNRNCNDAYMHPDDRGDLKDKMHQTTRTNESKDMQSIAMTSSMITGSASNRSEMNSFDKIHESLDEPNDTDVTVRMSINESHSADTRLQLESRLETFDMLNEKYSKWKQLHPILGCMLSGMIGGISVLLAKIVSQLFSVTVNPNDQFGNQFKYFVTYLLIFAMFILIILQIKYLNLALKYFDSLLCVPTFQCFFIMFSTLNGLIFFKEYSQFSITNWCLYPIGILITLIGVYIESHRNSQASITNRDDNFIKASIVDE